MVFEFANVNWVAVVAAAVGGIVVGFVWYLPQVFGRRWAAASGRDLPSAAEMSPTLMVGAIVIPLVVAYVLAMFMRGLGAASLVDGLVVGFMAWLGFAAAPLVNAVLYEKRSWEYWMLGAGFALVSLLVMGAIVGILGP